ncbi:MAG: NAD-dependent epimerase/dehydratase family protein, partial [Dehalococcoidia bacterium]
IVFVRADVRAFLRDYFAWDNSTLSTLSSEAPTFGDVIHLASIVGGRATIDRDPIAVAADLAIDADLFVWAIRAHLKRILYTSSSAAYPIDLQGEEGTVALKEDMIQFDGRLGQPDMTYGWSKLTGEYLARLASKHYGLHIACVRPFSGYGEDQDETYPVPAIAARAARREDPLIIWGSGDQGRDFIHIEDCVDAMFRALDVISDGSSVNLGSGRLLTFKQVAGIFAELAGYEPEIKGLGDMPTGVHARYADTRYSQHLLNWRPRIPVEDGFGRVYEAALQRISSPVAS